MRTPTSSNQSSRRADVQGLRAIAVILVVLFHAGLGLPGGFTGVDVFFVISGFVITRMLVAELASTNRIRLLQFYGRRVKRLLPALALVIVTVVAAASLLNSFGVQTVTAKTGVATAFFGANAYLYAAVDDTYFTFTTQLVPLLHTWTLAVEEQFYLVFPAVLLLAWRRISLRAAIGFVTAASFALSIMFSYGLQPFYWPRPEAFAFYSSPTRAWEFGVGTLLALHEARLRKLPRVAAQGAGVGGLAAVLAAAFITPDLGHFPGLFALLPVAGTAALIAAGCAGSYGVSRLLELRPATWVGDRSYSWYLWHWPFIVDARALWPGTGWVPPAAAAASLGAAWASFKYVENPIRFSPAVRGRRIAQLGIACIAVSVAFCGVLLAAHKALAKTELIRAWERSQVHHADFSNRCVDNETPIPRRLDTACTWRVAHPRGLIALLGDSNAGHFTEPATAAANAAGYDAVVFTVSACPFIELRQSDAFHTEHYCYDAVREELQGVAELRPALVVAANRDDGYIEDHTVGLRPFSGGAFTHSSSKKAVLWERSLHDTLATLNKDHVPVLVVDPVPKEPGVTQRVCAMIRLWLQGCDSASRRAAAVSELRRTYAVDRRAVLSVPDAYELNLINKICNAKMCPTVRNGTRTYFDNNHLSIAGADALEGTFRWAIQRVLSAQGRQKLAKERAELARSGRTDSQHLLVVDPVLHAGGHVRHT